MYVLMRGIHVQVACVLYYSNGSTHITAVLGEKGPPNQHSNTSVTEEILKKVPEAAAAACGGTEEFEQFQQLQRCGQF